MCAVHEHALYRPYLAFRTYCHLQKRFSRDNNGNASVPGSASQSAMQAFMAILLPSWLGICPNEGTVLRSSLHSSVLIPVSCAKDIKRQHENLAAAHIWYMLTKVTIRTSDSEGMMASLMESYATRGGSHRRTVVPDTEEAILTHAGTPGPPGKEQQEPVRD